MSFFDVFQVDEARVADLLSQVQAEYPDSEISATVQDGMIVLTGKADSELERGAIVSRFKNLDPDLTPVLAGGFHISETPSKKPMMAPPDRSVERHSRGTTQRIYRVKMGDTLEQLALRFYHDPLARRVLGAVNGELIARPDDLTPGWVLLVPEQLLYTVREGEDLESISRRFYRGNVMLESLINNNLELAQRLHALVPGLKLRIPFM